MKKRLALIILAIAAFAGAALHILRPSAEAKAADNGILLTGMVKATNGEKMAGVTVSANLDGSPVTTSVFTDADGNFYFPRLAEGNYHVWAQAVGYELERSDVPMKGSVQRKNFALKTTDNIAPQLTGDQWIASLPDDTKEDRRMKEFLRVDCVGCHTPAFALQNRFDEKGWSSILTLMSREVAAGRPPLSLDQPPAPAVQYFKPEVAAYLAKMRGPGTSPIKFKLRPRPTGDAALAVVTEYDVPLPDEGGYAVPDGSDWSQGTPDRSWHVHDVQLDFNGNLWFTDWNPNMQRTIGKIDGKTGKYTPFLIKGANGYAANSHAIIKDSDGVLWFNVRIAEGSSGGEHAGVGRSSLARLDPKTEKIDLFTAPAGMPPVGDFLDWDGLGNIWMAGGTGILRFDVKTHQFSYFKSPIHGSDIGGPGPYGVAGDKYGNGWWSQFSSDMEAKVDYETGKVEEIKLPAHKYDESLFTDQEKKVFQMEGENGFFWSVPWGDGPRRPGADKNGDFIWVPGWWSHSLMKIDVRTSKVTEYPMPTPDAGPYMAQVDKDHMVWINYQNSGTVTKFDPATEKWTEYNLPTLSFDTHQIGILDHNQPTEVVVGCVRNTKLARITPRTKEQVAALRSEVQETASNR